MSFLGSILNFIYPKKVTLPLVIICGCTGSGKSELAFQIAKQYNGEIINCDALQIYKGVDIITNKIVKSKQREVKHHLLGVKNIDTLNYSIHDFQKDALIKINELKNEKKMPILVGGTNYYIQSILWDRLVHVDDNLSDFTMNKLESMNNIELHNYLRTLDYQTAEILHPNVRRKVLRAIKISLNSSYNQSSHFKFQVDSRRFFLNETVFIWIDSDKEFLFPRLDKRLDEMFKNGVLSELEELYKLFLKLRSTRGIFQVIGFNHFFSYLECVEKESVKSKKIFKECFESYRQANKQYANYQIKGIQNMFLKNKNEEMNIPLFKVDSTDLSRWEEMVLQRTFKIIEDVRHSVHENKYSRFVQQLEIKPEPLSESNIHVPCYKMCTICNRLIVNLQQWNEHINGSSHMRKLKKINQGNFVTNICEDK